MLSKKYLSLLFGGLIFASATAIGTYFVLDQTGAIELTDPINLEISIKNEEMVYNGENLVPNDYSLAGELMPGHREVVTLSGAQNDVGTSNSDASVKIVDEDNNDVTDNYAIKVNPGTLTVTPKYISMNFGDKTLEYSGKFLQDYDFEITGGELVKGHKVIPQVTGGRVDVGDISDLKITPMIFDALGKNVTENYNIDAKFGRVVVKPRLVAFDLKTLTKEYDGKAFKCDWYISYGSLAEGHHAKVSFNEDVVNATENRKVKLNVKIFDENEEDVTKNYKIQNTDFELTVDKKNLSVTLPRLTKVFDGKRFDEKFINNSVIKTGLVSTDNVNFFIKESLLDTNVGSSKLTADDFDVDGADLSNYNITYYDGALTINKKEITISLPNVNKVYDGEPFDEEVIISNSYVYGLIENDEFTLSGAPRDCDAGSYQYRLEFNGKNKDNYAITIFPGTVEIYKAEITLKVSNDSVEYDGTKKQINNEVAVDGNINEVRINYDLMSGVDIIDAGTYPVTINKDSIKIDGNPLDASNSNYIVKIEDGSLVVTPKSIEVALPIVDNLIYSGESYTSELNKLIKVNGVFNSDNDLVIKFKDNLLIENAGEYILTGDDIKVVGSSKSNYDIDFTNGKAIINKKTVKISLNEEYLIKEYDGKPFDFSFIEKKVAIDTIIPGDEVSVSINGNSYETTFGKFTLSPSDITLVGEDRGNYVIDYGISTPFNFDFTKKDLIINLPIISKVYDGSSVLEQLIYSKTEYIGLVKGDIVNVHVVDGNNSRYINAGEYILLQEGFIIQGADASRYNTIINNGKVTITKKPINITFKEFNKTYDKETVAINETITSIEGQVPGDNVEINIDKLIGAINVGTYSYTVKDITLKGDKASNYDVYSNALTVKILPRKLTVTYGDLEKYYDGEPFNTISIDSLVVFDGLIDTDRDHISYVGYPKESEPTSTTYKMTVEFDAKPNYEISYVPGKLVINLNELETSLPTLKKEYDGESFNNELNQYLLILNDELRQYNLSATINPDLEFTSNVSTITLTKDSIILNKIDENSPVTIKVNFVDGYLTIMQRSVKLFTADNEGKKIVLYDNYDGKAFNVDFSKFKLEYYDSGARKTGLVSNDKIVYANFAHDIVSPDDNLINNNTSKIEKIVIRSANGAGVDVTSNYKIDYSKAEVSVIFNAATIYIDCSFHITGNYGDQNLGKVYASMCKISPETPLLAGDRIEVFEDKLDQFNQLLSPSVYELTYSTLEAFVGNRWFDPSNRYVFLPSPGSEGTITVNPKDVTITYPNISKTYDGEPFLFDNVTSLISVNGIIDIEGNPVQVDFVDLGLSSIIDCNGIIPLDNTIIQCSFIDMENYNINYVIGSIEITPKTIKVVLPTLNKTYDGDPFDDQLFFDAISVSGIDKNDVDISMKKDISTIVNAGTTIIDESYVNIIVSNDSLNKNHVYDYTNGALNIAKKAVKIILPSLTKPYDESGFDELKVESMISASGIDKNELIFDIIMPSYNAQNVGFYPLNESNVKISNKNQLSNYVFEYTNGYLEITPRTITVKAPSLEKEYNGEGFSEDLVLNSFVVIGELSDPVNPHLTGISTLDFINAGTHSILSSNIVTDLDHNDNYKVVKEGNSLIVKPRNVTIVLPTYTNEYNGQTIDINELINLINYKNNLESDPVEVINLNFNTDGNVGKINLSRLNVTKTNKDNNGNFELSYENGYVEITRKKVEIQLPTYNKDYDGNAIAPSEIENLVKVTGFSKSKLGLVIDKISSYIMVNNYPLNESNISHNLEGNHNYDVVVVPGEVNIDPRVVTICLPTITKEYNGTFFLKKEIEEGITVLNDPNGDILCSATIPSEVSAGEAKSYILNSKYVEITSSANYTIEYQNGVARITPRHINVTLPTITKEYDGIALDSLEVSDLVSFTGVESFTCELGNLDTLIDVGIHPLTFTKNVINYEFKNNDNYEVSFETGKVIITPRNITIYLPNLTKEYNESFFTEKEITNASSIVNDINKDVILSFKPSFVPNPDVGTTVLDENVIQNNLSGNKNYNINYVNGMATIAKKTIYVTLPNLTKTNDGTSLQNELENYLANVGLTYNISFTVSPEVYQTGSSKVELNESNVTCDDPNYNVVFRPGSLTITA